MKKYHVFFVLAVIFTLVAVLSCSTSKGSQKWEDANYSTMMSDYEGYQSWYKVNKETITGDPFNALGPAHAGKEGFREIYVNRTGKAVSTGKADYPYPVGTIIVKETYPGEGGMKGNLDNLTIMVKRSSGYDPANNNWEYLMITADNEVMAQGKLDMCIGCHAVAADDDYVFNNQR
jgi:hypothetical protein